MSSKQQHDEIVLDWEAKKNGWGLCRARINGDKPLLTLKINSTLDEHKTVFINKLCKRHRGIDRRAIEDQLEEIAAQSLGGDDAEMEKLTAGQHAAKLAATAELFHSGETAYATIEQSDDHGTNHQETYAITSLQFQRWLEAQFFRTFGRPATSAAINDAIGALSGKAIHFSPEKKVAVRVAEHGGSIYLDLADESWRCARITAKGWSIVKDPPVKFLRRKGMSALPTPVRNGGGLSLLKPLLNIADQGGAPDPRFVLMVAWMLGALHPHGPYPILCLNGEHGSAKSTTTKMLRMLIDPNKAMVRSLPRDERDLMIQASNSWVCAYDNISGMRRWVSDVLCCLATGGGFGTRKLHTDDDEMLFDVKRPVMLNGIEEDATKEDLLDRTIRVTLPVIRRSQRRTEQEIWSDYELVAPEVLGGLLDAASCALANVARTRLAELPRMADFATWVVAAEPALPWEAGTFLAAYAGNRTEADDAILEQSAIAPALLALLDGCVEGEWTGTIRELLTQLKRHADEAARDRDDWPNSVQKLGAMLRRLAPALRNKGIDLLNSGRTKERRIITLRRDQKVCANLVTLVTLSPPTPILAQKQGCG